MSTALTNALFYGSKLSFALFGINLEKIAEVLILKATFNISVFCLLALFLANKPVKGFLSQKEAEEGNPGSSPASTMLEHA